MAALTASRNTPQWGLGPVLAKRARAMKSNTKIFQGSIVVSDAGLAAPGRTATSLIPIGVAERDYDNLTATAANLRDAYCNAIPGVFKFGNSASGDLIADTDFGKKCYIVDDQTVALTDNSGARSLAGFIEGVDADGGVWVSIGVIAQAVGA